MLGDPALAGDIVSLAPRARVVGGQDGGIGHEARIHGAERIIPLADDPHAAAAEFPQEPGHGRSIALAEEPARPDHGQGKPPRAGQLPEDLLAIDLAPGVIVQEPDILAQGLGLIDRALAIPGVAVGAGRADVEESIDAGAAGGLGERAGGLHAARLERAPGSPIADLRRTVIDVSHFGRGRGTRGGVGQIAPNDLDGERLEKRRRAPGRTRARTGFPRRQALGQMAAQQARRPGDQDPISTRPSCRLASSS